VELRDSWAIVISTPANACLETRGIEPTNNAAERALRQSVIHRKISHGVQSR
jgi:transposase